MKKQIITNKIISRIYGHGRGWCFSQKDFADLGQSETIGRILRRITEQGTIRRIERGIFEYPKKSLIFEGYADPDMESVVDALARAHHWTLIPDENTSLNLLGLSTQVPANWVYFTNGPNRDYEWIWGRLKLRKRSIKETSGISRRSAIVVHGLKGLGQQNISDKTLLKLREFMGPQDWIQTVKETKRVTSWVHDIILLIAQGTRDE